MIPLTKLPDSWDSVTQSDLDELFPGWRRWIGDLVERAADAYLREAEAAEAAGEEIVSEATVE